MKHRIKTHLLAFLCAWTLLACKSTKETSEQKVWENFQGQFEVVELAGIDLTDKGVTMLIDTMQNRVSGNSGCNSYSGSYAVKNKVLSFGPLMTTKMYCTQKEKNDIEKQFQKTMTQNFNLMLKDGLLYLKAIDTDLGNIVLKKQ